MSRQPLLEIKDLRVNYKVYGGLLAVLDGVNFVVYPGEKVGLVGETGCGKTSTMKAILRILPMPPAQIAGGEITFKGQDILKMSQNQLYKVRGNGISMIFQDPTAALNPVFTVGQQMDAVLKNALFNGKKLTKRQINQEALQALVRAARLRQLQGRGDQFTQASVAAGDQVLRRIGCGGGRAHEPRQVDPGGQQRQQPLRCLAWIEAGFELRQHRLGGGVQILHDAEPCGQR